jgi:hypothetical protein
MELRQISPQEILFLDLVWLNTQIINDGLEISDDLLCVVVNPRYLIWLIGYSLPVLQALFIVYHLTYLIRMVY